MAYELSGSIADGNVVSTRVLANASTQTFGGSISPDGTMIAVRSLRHGGASTDDHGIDIWKSGSSGWSVVDSIDTGTRTHDGIMWLNNVEFISPEGGTLYSFRSGSSGWAEDYNTLIGLSDSKVIWPNADKTKLAFTKGDNIDGWDSRYTDHSTRRIAFMESGSSGYTSTALLNISNMSPITAITWVDDSNIVMGAAGYSNTIGTIRHYNSGSSGWTLVKQTLGISTSAGLRNWGSMLYYHTASNTLLVGGAGAAGPASTGYIGYINLIPSGSSSLLPDGGNDILSTTGYELIHLGNEGLTADSNAQTTNDAPYWLDGITLSVDPTDGDRFVVASAVIHASQKDGRVFITAESGSLGWKFNQLNPEGDGLHTALPSSGWGHQLSEGASRYVATLTGSTDTATTEGFTVYSTGLSAAPPPPSLIISPTSITLSESGTTASVTVTLSQDPGSVNFVDVSVSIPDSTEVSVDGTLKQLSDSNWNTGVTFTFTGLDDEISDGDQAFNVAFSTTCSGDASFDGLTENLSVTVEDNDTAGFTLGESSLTLVENNSDTISVVLDVQPVSDVVITASLAGSFSGRATISPSQLTFTNSNWNTASNITVSAVSDSIDNGDVTGDITFSIVTADSSDEYDSVASQTVSLTVTDDDTAGFTISPSSPFTVAEGAARTISVVLNSQPTSDVFVDISSAAAWNGRASMSPSQLQFEVAKWNQAQTVSITAGVTTPDNSSETDTVTFSINDSLTSDVKYLALSDQAVDVTVDVPFRVGSGFKLITSEMGMTATSPIRLNAQPTSDVVVTISGLDTTEGEMTPSTSQLTFTTSNWSTDQNIIFTGIQDGILDSNQEYTVTVTAASLDPNYNGTSITISVINIDSTIPIPDGEPLEPPVLPAVLAGTAKAKSRATKTQADHLPKKVHFEPSTIETIDRSVLSYLTKLNLFSDTNEGWKKVPIIWGTAERAYQVKHNKEIRDQQGMLKFPIISIKRTSLTKDMASKGVFQANVPAIKDEQGGSLTVGRVIYQDKTSKFAYADAARLHNQGNYPRKNQKVVYRTVTAPMPVNVTVTYDITIRTEYQQQMNDLMLPFITNPGTINYVRLFYGEHRYEAFIQGEMQSGDNLKDFSAEERKFETTIQLKVVGYLVGQEGNSDKPHYAVRENAVEVKIPRERLSLAEIPEFEYGAYYGLEGIQTKQSSKRDLMSTFFFSNVPAVGVGIGDGAVAGGSSGGGGGVDIPEGSNLVTTANFAEILGNNMVVRELLKAGESAVPSPANQLVATAATIRTNTESVFVNGMIQAVGSDNDYTISGNTITFTYDLEEEDAVYITYIKG